MGTVINRIRLWGIEALRWSEKYTKTDMVYLSSGGFWLAIGQGVSMLSSLALAVAFAHLLSPELYGNYKYVLEAAGIVSVFTLSGLANTISRSVARGHEGTLAESFRLTLWWSAGIVLAAGVTAAYYFLHGNTTLGFSFLIVGATMPLISASSLYRPFLMGKKYFRQATLLSAGYTLLTTLIMCGTLLLTKDIILLILTYYASSAIGYWMLYRITISRYVSNSVEDPINNIFGKHVSVMNVISTIGVTLDSLLVFQLMGGAELAVFTFATAIPDNIRGSLKNIATLALPKFANKTKAELKKTVYNKTIIMFIVTAALALLYILAAPFVFKLFFPLYLSAVPYSQVYAVTILISMVLSSTYFDAQVAIKERYILNITSSLVKIIAGAVGIILFGLWGAIIGRIVARLIIVSVSALLILRH